MTKVLEIARSSTGGTDLVKKQEFIELVEKTKDLIEDIKNRTRI